MNILLPVIFGLEELAFLLVRSHNYRCNGSFQGVCPKCVWVVALWVRI